MKPFAQVAKSTDSVLLSLLLAVAATSGGCGGGAKPAEAPSDTLAPQPSASAPTLDAGAAVAEVADAGASPAAAPTPEPAPTPLAAVLLTDTGEVQKIYDAATAAPQATLKPSGAGTKGPIEAGLNGIAKKAAPGMQADGPIAVGTLKEKGHLQTSITLQPGKCYALVGFAPKAKDLDLYVLTPPGILAGQDTTDDNKPVVGRAPDAMCPAASRAITYTVDIFADQGGGDLGVQLYSKDKGAK